VTLRVTNYTRRQPICQEVQMIRWEILEFVENETKNGSSLIDAIQKLLLILNIDTHDPILWFQQSIGGE
jgi:hypothetical protein